MNFRACGNCTACCDGHVIGNSHGNKFGFHKPCVFLVNKLCSIYKDRPSSCHNFQCAWTQKLFPEWMKPSECGVLISVEINKENGKQFLRIVEMKEVIEYDVYREIQKFCSENDTYYVKVTYESNSRDPRL
jgi:hypothetical protein